MERLRAVILGSAAGGGFPQWNCRCPVCRLAWAGDVRVRARTQTSIAVSVDGNRWVLLNAAPDLRTQIIATPALQPQAARLRDSPVEAVILTGAEVDEVAGLLHLRERQPLAVIGTTATLDTLAANPIFDALAPDVVERRRAAVCKPFSIAGIEAELFTVPGKVPLYLEQSELAAAGDSTANVGISLRANGSRLLFVPGAAAMSEALKVRLAEADIVMFDGTLFTDNEMIRNGSGEKTGRRMGHMPIGGADGSLAALAALPGRRFYIHINNTNPILIEGSPERRRVEAAGIEVAADGMEIVL